MIDHIANLEKYLKKDFTYNYYLKHKHEFYSDLEKKFVEHCEDVKWAIDELKALYGLVDEMKKKYE